MFLAIYSFSFEGDCFYEFINESFSAGDILSK